MLIMDFKERERLHEVKFDAYIKYEIFWVTFKVPLISRMLRKFLKDNGLIIFIDEESGMTGGVWLSGPYPVREYNHLRDTFKSYGVELPPLTDLPKRG